MENKDPLNPGPPVISVGTVNISPLAKRLVMETLNSNRLSYGPMARKFEADFARQHGCRFGVFSNSGTSALQIALQTMKELHQWKDGDEVIIPAVTFVATANIVIHNRMTPVIADVDPLYYEIDAKQIEAKITPRTRAIIPVHLFGQPADMDPIWALARKHNLKIIEDSAETMFASYNGKPVGSLGDIACFSTYIAHLLVTGVGGLNTTNNPEYAVRLHSLMNHGRDSIYISIDDDKNKTSDELRMVIARRFKFTSVGHSFRATEMEAALGLAQLEEAPSILAARRANAASLTKKLAHLEQYIQLPKIRPGSDHSFMMYPIVLRDRSKVELVNFLENNGVGTRDMLPLTNQPVYEQITHWKEDDYPVAKWINNNGFYIGCHQDLSESDFQYVSELFEMFFRTRPQRSTDSACLVMTLDSNQSIPEGTFDEIPRDLFERTLVVLNEPSEALQQKLVSMKIETLIAKPKGILRMITERDLVIDQENIVLFPADGHYSPKDTGRLLLALERGNDLAIASRFLHGGARYHVDQESPRSMGNRFFTMLANMAFYGNFSDSLSTFIGIKRSKLIQTSIADAGLSGHYQLAIEAMKRAWKVHEIPAVERLTPRGEERKQIVKSLFPLTKNLLREWLHSVKPNQPKL